MCLGRELLGDLRERLALQLGHVELEFRWLTGSVTACNGAGTPQRSAVHLIIVGLHRRAKAERHEHEAVVREEWKRREGRSLLSAGQATRAEEDAGGFAKQSTSGPEPSSRVKQSSDLRWSRAETRGDAEEDAVGLLKDLGRRDWVVLLGSGMHHLQHFVAQRLLNLVDGGGGACFLDTRLDGFGELGDVAVGRVVDDADLGHGVLEAACWWWWWLSLCVQ